MAETQLRPDADIYHDDGQCRAHGDYDCRECYEDAHPPRKGRNRDGSRTMYVVAVYEMDRRYGGPEEGGWWYDSGELRRISKVFKNEDAAYAYCRRANDLLHHFQRNERPISSVAYAGGIMAAEVHENNAPQHYPEQRPHYE